MWCPNQECPDALQTGSPAELRDEIRSCPFCGSSLVSSLPEWAVPEPEPEEPGWIPVLAVTQDSWVPIVRGLLESAGIRYVINHLASPPALMVHGDDAGQASALLADFREAALEAANTSRNTADQGEGRESAAPTESESPTPPAESPTRCNACGEDLQSSEDDEPLTYCYHCGASLQSA